MVVEMLRSVKARMKAMTVNRKEKMINLMMMMMREKMKKFLRRKKRTMKKRKLDEKRMFEKESHRPRYPTP